jgi:integrase
MGNVYRIGKKWGGCYIDHKGKRRQKTLSHDKQTARQMLRQLELRAQRVRAGLEPVVKLDAKVKTMLDAWQATLPDRRPFYRVQQVHRATTLLRGAVTLEQIDLESVERILRRLRVKDTTRGHYVQAVRQFCRWLVRRRYLASDPLADLAKPPAKHATRRPLTEEEITRLLVSERWPRYAVALGTGFRVNELRNLKAEDFHGDHVNLAACHAKNRKSAVQPLPIWLQEMLTTWLPGRTGILFPAGWSHAARTLRSDAKADDLCFHCLRHTYITQLVTAGLPPKTVQLLARHSDFRLTFDRYTHISDGAVSRALRAWQPEFCGKPAAAQSFESVAEAISRLADALKQFDYRDLLQKLAKWLTAT